MDGDNELEQLIALGQILDSSYLTNAAKKITELSIMANNATGAMKSNEVSMASDLIGRSVQDLIKQLRAVIQTTLHASLTTNHHKLGGVGHDEHDLVLKLEMIGRRAINGGINTMIELEKMVEFMIKVGFFYID